MKKKKSKKNRKLWEYTGKNWKPVESKGNIRNSGRGFTLIG